MGDRYAADSRESGAGCGDGGGGAADPPGFDVRPEVDGGRGAVPVCARGEPDAGGLLAYGTRVTKAARRLAAYVDRIVKGAQPADLPFEVVVRPELIVNLKTAQEIGVTIPPEVLKRTDRVIQ